VRLLDFFADREPWGEFWRLLSVLGTDSRYRKAILDDPEAVAVALSMDDGTSPSWRPESAEWTSMHELLASVVDSLGAIAALVADGPIGVKKRHEHPPPYPRPETELARQRKAIEAAKEQEYDDRLLNVVDAAKARWRAQHPDAPKRGPRGDREPAGTASP
jgi:hypothetical protein